MPWQRISRMVQEGSLYALLVLLPFSKAAVEIAFALLLASWLVERIQQGWSLSNWNSQASRLCMATLLLYLGICALSILTSSHPDLSLRGFIRKTLEYALLFVIVTDTATDTKVAKRALGLVMLSAFVVSLDALAQEVIGQDPLRGHRLTVYDRMTGPYENPIDLATYLMVVIPIVLASLPPASLRGKALRGGLALLVLGCLVRTESIGAWLGLLVGLGVLAVLAPRMRKPLVVYGLGFLLVGGFWSQVESRGIERSGIGMHDRVFMWQAAWHMITARPLLGHGLNTFMANYLTYWVGGEQQPRYAHNCFLQVAAETGVLGLAAFTGLLGAMGLAWWRALKVLRETKDHHLLVSLVPALVAFIAQSCYDTNFYALRQAALFWTLAGVATGLSLTALQRETHHARVA